MDIKLGDMIHYRLPEDVQTYRRLVRSITTSGVKVYFDKNFILVDLSYILRVRTRGKKAPGGKNKLASVMFKKGIRNEDLAEKSGYSIGTVDRARRGIRVKPCTLKDLIDSAAII